jgi:hypothetical protein
MRQLVKNSAKITFVTMCPVNFEPLARRPSSLRAARRGAQGTPESTSGASGTMEDADRSPDAAQDVDMGTAMVRPGHVERVESSSDLPVEALA